MNLRHLLLISAVSVAPVLGSANDFLPDIRGLQSTIETLITRADKLNEALDAQADAARKQEVAKTIDAAIARLNEQKLTDQINFVTNTVQHKWTDVCTQAIEWVRNQGITKNVLTDDMIRAELLQDRLKQKPRTQLETASYKDNGLIRSKLQLLLSVKLGEIRGGNSDADAQLGAVVRVLNGDNVSSFCENISAFQQRTTWKRIIDAATAWVRNHRIDETMLSDQEIKSALLKRPRKDKLDVSAIVEQKNYSETDQSAKRKLKELLETKKKSNSK